VAVLPSLLYRECAPGPEYKQFKHLATRDSRQLRRQRSCPAHPWGLVSISLWALVAAPTQRCSSISNPKVIIAFPVTLANLSGSLHSQYTSFGDYGPSSLRQYHFVACQYTGTNPTYSGECRRRTHAGSNNPTLPPAEKRVVPRSSSNASPPAIPVASTVTKMTRVRGAPCSPRPQHLCPKLLQTPPAPSPPALVELPKGEPHSAVAVYVAVACVIGGVLVGAGTFRDSTSLHREEGV